MYAYHYLTIIPRVVPQLAHAYFFLITQLKENKMLPFAKRLSYDQRKREFDRIEKHRHTHTAIIVQQGKDSPPIDKEKFLVPHDLTVAHLQSTIRKRLNLSSNEAIFLLCNDQTMPLSTMTMDDLRKRYASRDGFVYITYNLENTFG